jgi:predicted Zn finger-like uncharacterized protein
VPLRISCPFCKRRLRVADNFVGRTVRCPSCKETFKAVEDIAEIDTASPIEDEPESRRPAASSRRPKENEPALPRPSRQSPPPEKAEEEEERTGEEEEEERRPRRRRQRGSSAARSAVAGPAIALMVVGGISAGLYLVQLIMLLTTGSLLADKDVPVLPSKADNAFQRGFEDGFQTGMRAGGVVASISGICWGSVVITGAYQRRKLRTRRFAITASILAMLPCSLCCLLGLPFGIWSLVVLNRPEVRDAFR